MALSLNQFANSGSIITNPDTLAGMSTDQLLVNKQKQDVAGRLMAEGFTPGTQEFNDAYKTALTTEPDRTITETKAFGHIDRDANIRLAKTLSVLQPDNTILKAIIASGKR